MDAEMELAHDTNISLGIYCCFKFNCWRDSCGGKISMSIKSTLLYLWKHPIYIYIYIYIIFYCRSKEGMKIFQNKEVHGEICIFRIYLSILFLHTCMFLVSCFRQRTCMSQGLVNGVFNETHMCLHFEWFSVGYVFFYEGHSLLFLWVCFL